MYPNMQTKELIVDGQTVLTDSEGYIVQLDQWSEAFVQAQAATEDLILTDEHWQVVKFLRHYFQDFRRTGEVSKTGTGFSGRIDA